MHEQAWAAGCRGLRKKKASQRLFMFQEAPPPVSEQNRNALGKEGWDVIEHQSWCIVGVLGKNYELCMSDWLDGSMNDAKTLVAFCRDKLSFGPKSIKNTCCTSGMEMTVVFWGSPLNLKCNGNLQRPDFNFQKWMISFFTDGKYQWVFCWVVPNY